MMALGAARVRIRRRKMAKSRKPLLSLSSLFTTCTVQPGWAPWISACEACFCPDFLQPLFALCVRAPATAAVLDRLRLRLSLRCTYAVGLRADSIRVRNDGMDAREGSRAFTAARALSLPRSRSSSSLFGRATHARTGGRAGSVSLWWDCPFICESLFAFRTRPLRTRAPSRTSAFHQEANSVWDAYWPVEPGLLSSAAVIPVARATRVSWRAVTTSARELYVGRARFVSSRRGRDIRRDAF
ncbi:hypothetical protein FKP32DRAFT_604757 [Trametes sanguinea]|nr:hypothetical protein FKP32DRAFT_604757 [Trametes sanguinea]